MRSAPLSLTGDHRRAAAVEHGIASRFRIARSNAVASVNIEIYRISFIAYGRNGVIGNSLLFYAGNFTQRQGEQVQMTETPLAGTIVVE